MNPNLYNTIVPALIPLINDVGFLAQIVNSSNIYHVQDNTPSFPAGTNVLIGTMTSSSTYTISVPMGYVAPMGTSISGELWIIYTTDESTTTQYQELASITAKETSYHSGPVMP